MISFLLGSGFSIKEGVPGVNAINETLKNLCADQIFLGSDQSAFLLKEGEKDPNGWFPNNVKDRKFVVELIQFYIQNVIKDPSAFNYEIFFDYYYIPYINDAYPADLQYFLDDFRVKNSSDNDVDDNANLLLRFHNIFSQIVASKLSDKKYYEDVSMMNYPKYEEVIQFLEYLASSGDIKIHSLNHDLFFEHLGQRHSRLVGYYCDGYTDMGSPYYGDVSFRSQEIIKSYKARIKFFDGKFDNKLCFYKLHGSIDTYIFSLDSSNPDHTRVKRNWLVEDLYKEVFNKNTGKFEYMSGFQYNYPDFLSGTTAKTLSYNNDYYKVIFDHFRCNLQNSDHLFVIGYGFKDEKINEIIEQNYLSKGKKMIVIDPYPKEDAFKNRYNIVYTKKGVTELNYTEWVSLCESNTMAL